METDHQRKCTSRKGKMKPKVKEHHNDKCQSQKVIPIAVFPTAGAPLVELSKSLSIVRV